MALSEVTDRVRAKHLERAGAEADAASRRRWGVDEA